MAEIKGSDFTVHYDDSKEAQEEVFLRLITWFKNHEAFDGESICQSDSCIIDATQILSEIADEAINFDTVWEDNFEKATAHPKHKKS